jgi:hypothetical protein
MIEVWTRDEYGQASLHGRFSNKEEAMKKANSLLESMNLDNALTSIEREKNWECYMPMVKHSSNMLYGGRVKGVAHTFFDADSGESTSLDKASVYLGKKNDSVWLAKNHKNIELDNLNDPSLKMKSFVFFKKV